MNETTDKEKLMEQKPDTALVKAALDGDAESFTELSQRYYPAMVAIAHSIIGDRHLAEDAAQQTFARAAVKLPHLRNRDKFAGWLAVICRNAAKDIARRTRDINAAGEVLSRAGNRGRDDSVEEVREALDRLSASSREVIYLRFYDGLSYEQISAVMGISEQAINGRLRRAKRKMAEYLRKHGYGEV